MIFLLNGGVFGMRCQVWSAC